MKKFYVAGVKFHQLKQCSDKLEDGIKLDLIPEPENRFDPNAVKIEYDDYMLGYVPKQFSAEVAAEIEMGDEVTCTLDKINMSRKPWEQLRVVISNSNEGIEQDKSEDVEDTE